MNRHVERADAVIVYAELRAVHVERHAGHPDRRVLYTRRNYDISAMEISESFERSSVWGLFLRIIALKPRIVEVNEPAGISAVFHIFCTQLAMLWLQVIDANRPLLVTYAIENFDPIDRVAEKLHIPRIFATALVRPLLKILGARYDRVAFGTEGSRHLYLTGGYFRQCTMRSSRLFPALASPCRCGKMAKCGPEVVFLGAFDERKGTEIALAAWKASGLSRTGARMMILGKGPRESAVRHIAAGLEGVSLLADPPRDRIHEILLGASVLVAPSRRTKVWREQVGLPILEALSHGCTIVTSTETGIAQWLAENGHSTIDVASGVEVWAREIASRVETPCPPAAVLESLPVRDTRLQAEDWLFQREGRQHAT